MGGTSRHKATSFLHSMDSALEEGLKEGLEAQGDGQATFHRQQVQLHHPLGFLIIGSPWDNIIKDLPASTKAQKHIKSENFNQQPREDVIRTTIESQQLMLD